MAHGGTGQAANIGGTSSANNGQNGSNGGDWRRWWSLLDRDLVVEVLVEAEGGGFGLAVNSTIGDWTVTTTQSSSDGQSVSSPGHLSNLKNSMMVDPLQKRELVLVHIMSINIADI